MLQFEQRSTPPLALARGNPYGESLFENERLISRARKLTGLKTKREIVAKALELLVRSETLKGVLAYYGSGVWKGDLKSARRNHA